MAFKCEDEVLNKKHTNDQTNTQADYMLDVRM